MESATKNKQKQEDIIKMVHHAFGRDLTMEDISIKELTEGYFNVAYEIGLSGQAVILKIAPDPGATIMSYEKNVMAAEVEGLRRVREETEVPVPQVLFYDDSKGICNGDYFFMEKLSGESFNKLKGNGLDDFEVNKILYGMGEYNKEINQIKNSSFGYLGQPDKQGKEWKDIFLSMISRVLEDGEKIEINLGIEYDRIRNQIDRASFSLMEVKEPVLVHWDLWDGNVFVKDRKISGIIDFERALWGDPLMEYYFRQHACQEEFIKGYGTDLRLMAPMRALLYDIYLYLIMIIETKYRNYPDNWQYQFATSRLAQAVEELDGLLNT